ncbi:MAG: NADP(H)-dependent aldo-keto reductase [Saprospiraceae bacterium]|nr:NADP(H)-dependent aldo-keto reductase [Saprospiraceae bacterium]MCB9319299.1 NADP(H)-dependent aldo-keto reductase [Lewinellaceae bacterium]
MEYRILGQTGLNVSKICLGTMTWGEQNSESDAHEQLNYALERGINFIDTAELYAIPSRDYNQGLTEKYLGTWLKNRGKRDDLILASKIVGPREGIEYIRPDINFSSESIRTAINGSLQRLNTDYLDLYQLHWPERKANYFGRLGFDLVRADPWQDNFLEILHTMDLMIKEGKIRYWGVSNETAWGVMHFLHLSEMHDLPRCVSVQNPYSLLNRSYEVGLAEVSIREKVPLLAYSPMAFGLLSGKYHKGTASKQSRINQFQEMSRYNSQEAYNATSQYVQIAEENGLSPAQLALAFVNERPFLCSNIIGATSMAQLKENIDSADVKLSPEILNAINQVHRRISNPAP